MAALAVGLALSLRCGAPTEDPEAARRAVFEHVGAEVIKPTLEAFVREAGALASTTEALCAAPDAARLEAAQEAWRVARAPWSRSEAFAFGPVKEIGVKNGIDFWPARPDNVETAITLAVEINAGTADSVGASAKGLPAMEYLLFGEGYDDALALAAFTDVDAGAHRCAYLTALARDLEVRATALADAWLGDGGHLGALQAAGAGSELYPTTQDALDELVNGIVGDVTVMVEIKLGKPLGDASGGIIDPGLVESRFSDNALADLREDLVGAAAIYLGAGDGGEGLTALVRAVDPALDARVRAGFIDAAAAIDGAPRPLRLAIESDGAGVTALQGELDALRRLLKLEVVSALGVTLTLTDNDGD
ncbi:MAG: imelysin family protein [Nannocystaceae bacterium]